MNASQHYWQRVFRGNPELCSWQAGQQVRVRDAVQSRLNETPGAQRVLDFGAGNLGLYRALDPDLMRRITLLGISESPQHDPDDPLFDRCRIQILIGPGLQPFARVAAESQDHVVCSYVFAYLNERTRARALQRFARVLVPGGRLTLVLHHPRGARARKLQASAPYWPALRTLYARLLERRYAEAHAALRELDAFLQAAFGNEPAYHRYLASYLKTARRFLAMFGQPDQSHIQIPHVALLDCEDTQRLIDREQAMTCDSFRPVLDPLADLPLASELTEVVSSEHLDPISGRPIANVLCARKAQGST
jgi:SAM-dependent methyltransferase